jgi:hypothetical protein
MGGTAESFGMKFAADLVHGRTQRAWPHTPTYAVAVAAVLLALCIGVVVIGAVSAIARWRPAPGDPVATLARNPLMRALTRRSPRARRWGCAGLSLTPCRAGSTPFR